MFLNFCNSHASIKSRLEVDANIGKVSTVASKMWRQLGERINVSRYGIDIKLFNPYPMVFSMDVGTRNA